MRTLGKFAVLVLVGVLAWASLLPATRTSRVFGDEIGWISASSRAADLVRSGDFDWDAWEMSSLGAYGAMNPPVGKLAIGLPMRLGNPAPPFDGLWDWSLDEVGNEGKGNLPPRDELLKARRIVAMHSALLVVAVCALGWSLGGPSVGLIAAALLCVHPTWRATGPLLLTDMLHGFLLVLMAFPAIGLLRRADHDRGLFQMVLLGSLMGVAAAVKPTGLVLGGMFVLSIALYRAVRSRRIGIAFQGVLAAFLVSGATLVALDPWLWPDLGSARPSAVLRETPAALGALRSPQPIATLEARREEYPAVQAVARPAWIFIRAMQWKHLVAFQRSLPSLQWQGPRLVVLADWLLLRKNSFAGEFVFVLIGLFGVFMGLARRSRTETIASAPAKVVILFTVAASVYVLALVVLPVTRYLLPLQVLLLVLAAQGIVLSAKFAKKSWVEFARGRFGRARPTA
jgi:hypothetical protein